MGAVDVRQALRRVTAKRYAKTRAPHASRWESEDRPPPAWKELEGEPLCRAQGRGTATRSEQVRQQEEALGADPPIPEDNIRAAAQTIAPHPRSSSGMLELRGGGAWRRRNGAPDAVPWGLERGLPGGHLVRHGTQPLLAGRRALDLAAERRVEASDGDRLPAKGRLAALPINTDGAKVA